jgi:L,D-transpeptidase ErfK/SrfK
MYKIFQLKPPNAKTAILLLGALLLGGCQNQPLLPPPDEATLVQPQLDAVATHEFQLTNGQRIVGTLAAIDTRENDSLPDIARHFGLGYNDVALANAGINPWTPEAGARVLLPLRFILPDAPHKGIVLNLANMRLFYYPAKRTDTVFTYPAGIGRQGWNTPTGSTYIAAKKANPVWYVPESILREHAQQGAPLPKAVPAGPDNPLGKYAMPLGFSGYLIHGTNKPYGIGLQVSHGCVQLYPEDIEALFKKAAVGMPVRIVHQPYLTAWDRDMLYLEVHPPLEKWASQKKQLKKKLLKDLRRIGAKRNAAIDWEKVERVLARADGIPTPILAQSPDIPELAATAPQLQRPGRFYGQPVVAELQDGDWAVLAATFDNEALARKLAAMLNHQGPPIPARKIEKDGAYQVVAGPFKDKKEVEIVAQRLKTDFDIDVTPLKPQDVIAE